LVLKAESENDAAYMTDEVGVLKVDGEQGPEEGFRHFDGK
jgi:hypothetical protein